MHDEQGTRDRPYDLIADFYPDRIDAVLRSLASSRGRRSGRASRCSSPCATSPRAIFLPTTPGATTASATRCRRPRAAPASRWRCRRRPSWPPPASILRRCGRRSRRASPRPRRRWAPTFRWPAHAVQRRGPWLDRRLAPGVAGPHLQMAGPRRQFRRGLPQRHARRSTDPVGKRPAGLGPQQRSRGGISRVFRQSRAIRGAPDL